MSDLSRGGSAMENIRSIWLCCLLVIGGLIAPIKASELDSLSYVTELYPPYNFKVDGQLTGIAVDMLLDVFKNSQAKLDRKDIQVMPWGRAYQCAVKGPNVVLFSTTRTSHREPLFQWVGPITETRVVLIARKSRNIQLSSLAQLKDLHIGVIRDDIGEQMVLSQGVDPNRIKRVGKASSLAKMLDKGRIDLWAYEENAANWFIRQQGFNHQDFESVYTLHDSQLYFTFSKDVPASVIAEVQQGIDRIKLEKNHLGQTRYQEILQNYLTY